MITRRHLLAAGLSSALAPGFALGQDPDRRPSPRPPSTSSLTARDLIAQSSLSGQVSFALADPRTGEMIEQHEADAPLRPASVLKVVTALYALDRLGMNFRFRTRVLRAGDLLILAGGGDPVLSTDDLAALADKLVDNGQTSPKRFAVWGGALPKIAEIAPAQADHLAYNPSVSGMILNFNRVHLGWRQSDNSYQMSLEARAARHSPRAYTIMASPANQSDLFSYQGLDTGESWTVSRAAMGRAGSRWLPVRKPELYAGDVFQTLCRAKGLVLPQPEVIEALPAAEEVAAHNSPVMRDILKDMLRFSTNLTAEVVGLQASGRADLQSSAGAMQDWLEPGQTGTLLRLVDHSGLATENLITAHDMTSLLIGRGRTAQLAALLKKNPLDEDLGAAPHPGVKSYAKTGTLNFVSNLAGYVETATGQQFAFSIFCSDQDRHTASIGQELPAGVATWTREAKKLQRRILDSWH